MAYVYSNIEDRIKNYVHKTRSCWIWIGHKNEHGYGLITVGRGAQVRAHRFIYEQTFGAIPKGLFALHKCDNPACVNPRHIRIGTQKENMQDMIKKDRGGYKRFGGEQHHNSKLSRDKINKIKELWERGDMFQREIGEKFGVTQQVISKIVNGKAWLWDGVEIIKNKNKQYGKCKSL